MCKKSVMPEYKYKLHISSKTFRKLSYQDSIKEGLVGILGNSSTAVKQYQKSKNIWKRELKYLNKQNQIISSMANRPVSHRELKNIKKICAKASNKYDSSRRYGSISESNSFLHSEIQRDKRRQPAQFKEMFQLDISVKNHIKNKDQCNDAIEYDPKFDNKLSLSSGTKYPLIVLTVSL